MAQLRPMSTGEILDRTFSNYRKNFKLFAGIAAVPAAILFLVQLLFLLVATANSWTPRARGATGFGLSTAALTASAVGAFVTLTLYLIGMAVSHGATAFAVSAVHLDKPTTIRECYARIKGRYWRMVNVIVSVYLRAFGVIILSYLVLFSLVALMPFVTGKLSGMMVSAIVGIVAICGIIVGLFIGIRIFARYSLAVPACVVEDIKARAAMKRSIFLSKGSVGKILAIYVLVVIINIAVSFGVSIPLSLLVVSAKSTAMTTAYTILQHLGSFVVGSIVGPLATIALSLVYFDERVRKEAFDIQYMMESLQSANTVPSGPPSAPGTPVAGDSTTPDTRQASDGGATNTDSFAQGAGNSNA